jgi:two-component system OmpR family response regulator
MQELAARVRAMLRRSSGRSKPLFKNGNVTYDTRTGRTTVDDIPIDLTSQEAAVLAYLVHNNGRLVSRTELSEHIYEYDGDRDSNTIAVFITRLRKKLGPDLIKTVRGRGYMVDDEQ